MLSVWSCLFGPKLGNSDSGITQKFSHFGIGIGIGVKSLRNAGIGIGIKIARNRNQLKNGIDSKTIKLIVIITFTGIETGIGIGIINMWNQNRNWN